MTAQLVSPRAAFQHRDFRLWQTGRILTTVAMDVQLVALGWHVYLLTNRAADLGYIGLARFLPVLLLSPLGGHVADRFHRLRVLAVCYVVLASASFGLYVVAHFGMSVAAIYALAMVMGATRAFAQPASNAILPRLVPPEHFANAVAWSSSLWQLATIAGPSVGGLVIAATGRAADAYLAATALFALATVFILSVRADARATGSTRLSLASLAAGVRYVFSNRMLLGAISLDLFAVLLGGATALLPIYARDILAVGAWGLGILRSAPGIGAAAVGALLAYFPLRKRAGAIMLGCVALFGVATVVFGVSRSFWVSLVSLAVLGGADMVSVVVRQTMVQLATPDEMRGRVSAVNMVFIGASNELGEFESGLTAAWFGVVPAVVIGGVGTIVVVGIWAGVFRELRKVESVVLCPEGFRVAGAGAGVTRRSVVSLRAC